MKIAADVLIGVSALSHLAFLYLEMFLWTKPVGMKIFRRSPEQAKDSASLAVNQGLYNGFLAAGLFWSLFNSDPLLGHQLKIFFLVCVIIAGIFGAVTANKKILFIQALPAAAALLLLFI